MGLLHGVRRKRRVCNRLKSGRKEERDKEKMKYSAVTKLETEPEV